MILSWPLKPVFPGVWSRPSRGCSDGLIRAMLAQSMSAVLLRGGVSDIRSAPSPFTAGVEVYEVLLNLGRTAGSAIIALHKDIVISFDGTAPPIHGMNAVLPPSLNDSESVGAYLRFFCACVCGEEGDFSVIDSLADLIPMPDRDPGALKGLAEQIQPLRVERDEKDGGFLCFATVKYSHALFHSQFKVFQSGMIEMRDDTPFAQDLPLLRTGFRLGLRGALSTE